MENVSDTVSAHKVLTLSLNKKNASNTYFLKHISSNVKGIWHRQQEP